MGQTRRCIGIGIYNFNGLSNRHAKQETEIPGKQHDTLASTICFWLKPPNRTEAGSQFAYTKHEDLDQHL